MGTNKKIGIIIVNFNTKGVTYNCVKSILDNSVDIEYSIMIWDNNSSDDSTIFFHEKFGNISNINIFASKSNLGFGRACNEASKVFSNVDYFLFLNPDTIFNDNILINFISAYDELSKTTNIGCLGVELYNLNGISIESDKKFPTVYDFIKSRFSFLRKSESSLNKKLNGFEYQIVDYICGADLFIEKMLFLKIGGFDEDYFMYYEEIDLQYRLKNKGFNNILLKNCGINHIGGVSLSNNSKLVNLYSLESLLKYFKKHSTFLEYFFLRMYLIFMFPFFLFKSLVFRFKSFNLKYLQKLFIIIFT
jgi:GT2 family glycosyltransferase